MLGLDLGEDKPNFQTRQVNDKKENIHTYSDMSVTLYWSVCLERPITDLVFGSSRPSSASG